MYWWVSETVIEKQMVVNLDQSFRQVNKGKNKLILRSVIMKCTYMAMKLFAAIET
jgi:hypothetical protein